MAPRANPRLARVVAACLAATAACSDADPSTLTPLGAPPDAQSSTDATAVDRPSPSMDVPVAPVDSGPPPVDVPTPPVDVPPPVDSGPPPVDVPTPPVDVPTPPPDVPMCRPCSATPSFCAGSGAAACLDVEFCASGCPRCVTPVLLGDRCASAPLIDARATVQQAFTTCGAADDLSVGCNREGNDIVLGFRVAVRGRAVQRFIAPPGVTLSVATRGRNEACVDTVSSASAAPRCFNDAPQGTVTLDRVLDPGIYYVYLLTSRPASVILQSTLP